MIKHPHILCIFSSLFTVHTAIAAESSGLDSYRQVPFSLPAAAQRLTVTDTNADGLSDLITIIESEITVYFQTQEGFDFDKGISLTVPGQASGWDLSYNYRDNNKLSVVALVDSRDVLLWHIDEAGFSEPQTLMSGVNGFLPRGVNRLYFSRDINSDSKDDLVIPSAGLLNLFIQNETADADSYSYQSPISVQSNVRISSVLYPDQLERRTGQSINIPLMELKDVNSDGYQDLVSRSAERLDVFIANSTSGQYFAMTPSYSLDIAEIESRLGEFDIDNLDFSNLTGVLALTHEEIMDDVNADGIDDLLLREAGKVSLYTGTSDGMNFSEPAQVLRSAGNVLSTFLYDENEDGLKDLWLWRVEPISIGDIFIWLALSGSVAVEGFVYPNEGQRFTRRPSRKLTVELKFPSVVRLATTAMSMAEELQATENAEVIPVHAANIDGNLSNQDLLVLINNGIEVFLNSIEPEPETEDFLGSLGYSRDRDNYEINIRDIIARVVLVSNPELERVKERSADYTLTLDTQIIDGDIIAANLNNDGRDDIFVFTEHSDSHIKGILLISQ